MTFPQISKHELALSEFQGRKSKGDKTQMKKYVWILAATVLFAGSVLAGPIQQDQQPAPDNTKTNQGDANKGATTADQQKMNPADRETTKQIRSAIMDDKSLSTYAHNVKIITRNGKVTLKGPVRSADEKTAIGEKATQVAGAGNVTNHLTIVPATQQ
jgi:hyperosmotically inducible protein